MATPRFSRRALARARDEAKWVGIGLIIVASFGAFSSIAVAFIQNDWGVNRRQTEPPPELNQAEREAWKRDQRLSSGINSPVRLMFAMLYIPVLIGGIGLVNGRDNGLAKPAAVIALLPCSLGFCFGLPVGIGALIVLSKREVKAATTHHRRRDREDEDDEDDGEEDDRPRRSRRRRYEDDDEEDDRPRRSRRRRYEDDD